MSDNDIFTRCTLSTLPDYVEGLLAHLAGKGVGGDIVRDREDQLNPPEAATWTGRKYQLALCWSGLNAWLELRQFLPQGRVVVGEPVHDRGAFTTTISRFAMMDCGQGR